MASLVVLEHPLYSASRVDRATIDWILAHQLTGPPLINIIPPTV
jgi:hypothetical protein